MQTAWGAAAVTFDLTGTVGSVILDGAYFFPAKEAGIGGTTAAGATVSGTGTWNEFYNVGMHVTQVAPTGGGLAVGAPCNTRYGWGSMTAACAISR